MLDGKPGDANKVVIEKLVDIGALLARQRITLSDAIRGDPSARDPSEPTVVLPQLTGRWAMGKTHGQTIRERALTSIDQLVT